MKGYLPLDLKGEDTLFVYKGYKMASYDDLAVVILAAGKGTRMKSEKAKVLHQVAGKSMVCHVVECALNVAGENIYVVVGHQAQRVKDEINQYFKVNFALQTELLGTGDAVKAALPGLPSNIKNVMVLCGDVPLIQEEVLGELVEGHIQANSQVTVLATDVENPTGYGRIVLDENESLLCIREEADASDSEKKINKINTGIYCFDRELLETTINEIRPDNNQAEYYLTDVVEIAQKKQRKIGVVTMADSRQVVGVNTLEDLENAESLITQIGK